MGNNMNGTRNVLIGLVIGGLAGAGAMLLFAPQSGKRTRDAIQLKGTQLRDRTSDIVKDALAQARFDTHEITSGVREKAGQLKQHGQDKLVKQLDRVSTALDAGKAAVKAA
ncbi:MAG: YtxH domain-containing protein [Anaerolineales bacterium]